MDFIPKFNNIGHQKTSNSVNAFNNSTIHAYNWPLYRLKAAEIISTHISRLYRGQFARRQILWHKYLRYDHAARIIQASYRKFRNYKLITSENKNEVILLARLHNLRRISGLREYSLLKTRNDTNVVNKDSLHRIIEGKYSFSDQMSIWRLVIDLRRAYPNHSVDSCIKAILESKGDMNRALTLLGQPVFASRYFDDLPRHYKAMFIPKIQHKQTKYDIHGMRVKRLKESNGSDKLRMHRMEREVSRGLERIYFSKRYFNFKAHPSLKHIYAPKLAESYHLPS